MFEPFIPEFCQKLSEEMYHLNNMLPYSLWVSALQKVIHLRMTLE